MDEKAADVVCLLPFLTGAARGLLLELGDLLGVEAPAFDPDLLAPVDVAQAFLDDLIGLFVDKGTEDCSCTPASQVCTVLLSLKFVLILLLFLPGAVCRGSLPPFFVP